MHNNDYQAVYQFWFQELKPKQWWQKSAKLDADISARFLADHERAAAGELSHWRDSPTGRLAEVILLDQLSRNMFRSSAKAFATDSLALQRAQQRAQQAIDAGDDMRLAAQERVFLYMPLMHSESLSVHQQAEKLFRQLADEAPNYANHYDYELRHKAIIERFGRYPHRNQVLGRSSTAAELKFLEQPGSRF